MCSLLLHYLFVIMSLTPFHQEGSTRVASLLLVAMPGAPSSVLVPSSNALVTSSFLLLLVRHLLLVAMHLLLVAMHLFLVASLFLVVMPLLLVASCYY